MRGMILAAAVAIAGTMTPAATVPSSVVVFGDSLSDGGNFGGRTATNGMTWAGWLGIEPSNRGGLNYAYGGAKAVTDGDAAPDFEAQRGEFLDDAAALDLGGDPLAVAWFGGNDLLAILTGALALPPQDVGAFVTTSVTGVLATIGSGVGELAGLGIGRFLLPNLPDLSAIPANAAFGSETKGFIAATTAGFNAGLAGLATQLSAGGLDVEVFDTAALFAEILAEPAAYGLATDIDLTAETCLRGVRDCDDYAFWDPIHPTGKVHRILAGAIGAEIGVSPVPLPATIWLLAGGLGGVVALGRRRRAAA